MKNLKEKIQSIQEQIRHEGIVLPTRFFNIGDKVSVGNLDNVRIDSIIDVDEMKSVAYVVEFDLIPNEYQQRFEPQYGVKQIFFWYEIFPDKSKSTEYFRNNQYILSYLNTSISYFFNMFLHNHINMNPHYQRDYVWSEKDKEELITSIFNQNEIGRFIIRRKPFEIGKFRYEIVDGKQRLNAIMDFFTGHMKWKGKFFHELHPIDRSKFKSSFMIMVCELPETLTDEEVIEIFIRSNISGKTMSKYHLKKIAKQYLIGLENK